MVKLTQVDDETATAFNQDGTKRETVGSFSESESEESDSDFEDDLDVENETFYDRVVALKDIIPPKQRTQFVSVTETLQSKIACAFNKGGSALWGVTSSLLLLGVPLSLAILSETQLQEMEKEMSLRQSAQSVLAPGSEEAFNEKTPATA